MLLFTGLLACSALALVGTTGMATDREPAADKIAAITEDETKGTLPYDPYYDRFSSHSFHCESLTTERLDPLKFEGAVSPHNHLVFGGSSFAPKLKPGGTISAKCTSCDIIQDKSLYWVPNLYVRIGGGFRLAPRSEIKVYYQ
jgi:hypothetical protein